MNTDGLKKILTRVLAAFLAFTLIMTSIVYNRATIRLNPDDQSDDAARIAAIRLLQGDEYANATTAGRMSLLMKHYLTIVRDYYDYELGASIAISQSNFEDALACTEHSIELYRGDRAGLARLYLRQGYLCIFLNRYQEAEDWLTRGIENGAGAEALHARALVRRELGRKTDAVADADACLEAGADATMLPTLVYIYESAGEYARLAEVYTRLMENEAKPEYLLHRASCYANLGDAEKTAADCAQYLAAGGEDAAEAWTMTGMAWMRSGDYVQAASAFAKAADACENPPDDLLYYTVLCAARAGDNETVCEYGDRVHERSSSVPQPEGKLVHLEKGSRANLLLLTATAHMKLGQYLQAAGVYGVYVNENPDGEPVRYQRAVCYLAAGQPEKAIGEITLALAAGEDETQCRYTLGLCYLQTGAAAEAQTEFQWVIENGNDSDLALQSRQMLEALKENQK